MWFKNLRIYRFAQDFTINGEALSAAALDNALKAGAFVPCNSQDASRYGWVSPLIGKSKQEEDEPSLVHASQGYLMICAKKQEKILPAAVINEAVEEKIAQITEAEGRPVGRKERQALKEDVMMELLPKAFVRSSLQFAYISPPCPQSKRQAYIVVNAASASKAEALLSALRDCVGRLPVVPLVSRQPPHQVMTRWLNDTTTPERFTLGDECELADPKEEGSTIRCKHQDLFSAEINNHLQAGMIVTKLNINWLQGINFVLDDQLAIKRLWFEDNIQEKADSYESQNTIEQFDIEFSVMTLELSALIEDLLAALGGANTDKQSVEEIVARVNKHDEEATHVDEVAFA